MRLRLRAARTIRVTEGGTTAQDRAHRACRLIALGYVFAAVETYDPPTDAAWTPNGPGSPLCRQYGYAAHLARTVEVDTGPRDHGTGHCA